MSVSQGHQRLPQVGERAQIRRTVTDADIVLFAGLSGDFNPVHLDELYAKESRFGGRIAHGMLCACYISAVLGTRLPGPGTIYLSQDLQFRAPVRPGDTITTQVEVIEVFERKRRLKVKTECINQEGTTVVTGQALLQIDEDGAADASEG